MYQRKLIYLLSFFIISVVGFAQKNDDKNSCFYDKAVSYYHSKPDSALFYVKKILKDSTKTSDYVLAKSYLLGGVLYKNIGKIDSSYFFYHTAEKIFTEKNDTTGIASVQNNLARLYHQSGRFDMSLQAFFKAVELFKAKNDSANLAETYLNVGDLYIELEQIEKGLEFYDKARKIFLSTNNKIGIAFIYTNLGNLKEKENKPDSALLYYKKSLKLLSKTDRKQIYADCRLKTGNLFFKQNKPDSAISNFSVAENIYKEIDFPLGTAKCKYAKGNYYLTENNYKLAENNYNKALHLARKVNSTVLYGKVLKQLYLLYKKTGNKNKSLKYFEKYTKLKDSIFSLETGNKIAEIQAKNDLLLRQNQINKLRDSTKIQKLLTEKFELKSKIRKTGLIILTIAVIVIIFLLILLFYRYREKNKLNKNLSTALDERNILLKELHHRVKNNLQIISSLLNLQKKHKSNKSVEEIIDISRNRIAAMVTVHEKLYRSKSFKNVDIKEYTEGLIKNVSDTFNSSEKNISTNVKADDIKLNINKLIPCGLILNELITNSFKHGFKGKKEGKFEVFISEENQHITINIKDNGIGFKSNTDFSKLNSLGMKLIFGLTEQINGKFEILSPNTGTHFKLTFKK